MSRPTVLKVRRVAVGVLLVGMSVVLTDCGPGRRTTGSWGGPRDDITRGQIEALADGTAFTIVQVLRAGWLRARTQATLRIPQPAYAHVFVDELYFGPLESLRQVSSSEIERIEYLDARNATTRYGTGYLGGIIRIIIR